jgi:hypothetical protein
MKTFSAVRVAPAGFGGVGEGVLSGVCRGVGVCWEGGLKKGTVEGECFTP